MCGFAAFFEPGRVFPETLVAQIDCDLFHRGPDSGGHVIETGHALVFRRLAILDPRAECDQPMVDPSGRFVLMFNGEIYNFRSLRRELEAVGVRIRTEGDTEILLQALITWGESALDRLEGMYAFVLFDRMQQTVLAARDPFGIKPLYLARKGKFVGFASEMRPLVRIVGAEPDPAAIAELLVFRFAAGRLSNLRGIERVPGGHLIRLSLSGGTLTERTFCDARAELHQPDNTLDQLTVDRTVTEAIERSVLDHMQSDVGFCVQLSGGIDSSLVTALSSRGARTPIRSYGINLAPASNDESRWRRMVTERYPVEHQEVALSGGDYAEALPEAIAAMEGPTAHTGCVLLMLLCREIAKSRKVVLTGEGADEFFGGYKRYGQWKEIERKGQLASLVPHALWPLLNRWRDYRRFAGRDAASYATVQGDYLATGQIFPEFVPVLGEREAVTRGFRDFRSRLFAVDQSVYLESLLLRQDKLSMASSLEARVPYVHLPLARVLNRIPHRLRAPGGETKPILKRIALGYLPRDLIYRRKVGLTIPVRDWLNDDKGLGRYLPLLTDADSRLAAYGDRRQLRKAVDAFRGGAWYGLPPLDHLIGMELWLRSLPIESRVA